MSKHKNVPAISHAAGLAARALGRLEAEAKAIHAAESEKRNRSLQLVSSKDRLSALIKCGKTTTQIEGDEFAVSTVE